MKGTEIMNKKFLKILVASLAGISLIAFSAQAKSHEHHKMMNTDKNHSKLKSQFIEYKDGNTTLEGYLVYDESIKGKRPAALVVHDWMGLGKFTEGRADELAKMGYIAFAPDIYGKDVRPVTPQEAGKQAGFYKSDRKLLRSRVNAGYELLKNNDLTNTKKIVALGYCFGGTTVLELGRSGADLAGIVTFHGGLDSPTPEDGKNIKGKVLILHGADDPYVPAKDIDAFKDELNKANVDWQMIYYSGAVHAFSIPGAGNNKASGAAYNEKAEKRSWEHFKVFLKELF